MSRFRKIKEKNSNEEKEFVNQYDDIQDYMDIQLPSSTPTTKKSNESKNITILGKKKVSELMAETIEQSMAQPISSSSKGFKLLQKFGGYSGDCGLGKNNQGIQEPLKVETRESDRSGIGSFDAICTSSTSSKRSKSESDQIFNELSRSYRSHIIEPLQEKKIITYLKSAERIIYELDIGSDTCITCHNLWPEELQSSINSDSCGHEEDSSSDDDRVEMKRVVVDAPSIEERNQRLDECLKYLRSVHLYCLFCGCRYESAQELADLCPGINDEDH